MARLKTIAGGIMQKLPAKSIYVKKGEETSEEVKSKKTTFSVGAILLVLLLVSIIFGVHQNRIKKIKLSYQAKLTQAEHSLDESIQLFSINPERSRELFLESSNLTKEMLGQGIKDTKLSELEKKLAENKGKILSEYSPGPQAYSDLSLLSSGFTAQLMNTSTEKALFLDTGKKILVSVDLETKKAKVEAGPEQLEGAKEAAFYSDSFYVLTEDGIYKVGKERTKVIDKGWEGESLIYAYAGNIYVLDKGRSEIYRYAGLASGFSEQKSWLAPGISLDLTNTSGWAIDGSIWVGSANGSIFKITQGVPKNINPAGVNPPLENIKAIYSNEEIEGVYVLDSINSRVIVLDKEGVYKASYFSDKLSEAKGLAVSESKKLIIFLAEENKLYSLELEHLD
jgi:hypothetical protein